MGQLAGQVVLITGGAGGIGAQTARGLVDAGANVALVDFDAGGLRGTAEGLPPAAVLTHVADVRRPEDMEAAVAATVERFGGLDVVVANAGVSSYGSVLSVDPEAFRSVIDVNLTGVFHTVRAALAALIERRGHVLVVSSLAAFAAAPGMAAYAASKAGAEQLANTLSLELAPLGVTVGCAHMSWIDTPLVRDARRDLPAFARTVAALPGPLSTTTSAERCAAAFVDGIARRRRRIHVPRWVGLLRWLRPALATRAGERGMLARSPEDVGSLDADVEALGRSMSERTSAMLTGARDSGAETPS